MEMEFVGFQHSPIADIGEPVHSAGTPIVLYGFNVVPEVTGTGPSVIFWEGPDDSGSIAIQDNTTADVPTTVMYPQGIVFPTGCFLDIENAVDVVQVTVFYKTIV